MAERWKLEPIGRFRAWLTKEGSIADDTLDALDQQVEQEIQAAVDFAQASPVPELSTVTEDVYA